MPHKAFPAMLRCVIVSLAALWFCATTLAPRSWSSAVADESAAADWSNPFCGAVGRIFPYSQAQRVRMDGATNEYELMLWSSARSTFMARMTLVDADTAYSVDIPVTTVPKNSDPHSRWPFFILFDHDVKISEYFVDGVSIDGAAMTDCPSFVQQVTPEATDSGASPSSVNHLLTAHSLQKLPALSCGSRFTGVIATHAYEPLVGHYGDVARSADVEAFVDSSGRLSEARIWHSSGIEGLDAAALGAVQLSTYKPAQFLCTPVVGKAVFHLEYQP